MFTALPGDVDQSDTTNSADISALANCLATAACHSFQCATNRLGRCTAADLARLVDLLNATGSYANWNGATTIHTPCPPQ